MVSAVINSPSIISTGESRSEDVTVRNEMLISILQTAHYDSRVLRYQECCVAENPLIVGPRLRSSKVLRDTIGERFLCDQKRSLFVGEFVPRHSR
jgi:hypothetical protein